MAIRIATAGRQKSVAALAKALFEVKGSPEAQARAEGALLRANPGIAAEGAIKPGTRIVVPSGGKLTPKTAAGDILSGTDPLIDTARERAESLAALAGEPLKRLIEESAKNQGEVKALVKRFSATHPGVREAGEEIIREARRELDRLQAAGDQIQKAVAELLIDLPGNPIKGQ